ncbi:aromatic ring-hydroxylating oxygenase subunit alpha [Candidatus Pelagibacter sp. HIMB1495]|uniref:aromatic ring-hydroxylating oxygenase subunit alpha n=1 Tax=unclassified Candidatus Pelagibacter TaxID=2647897 RepID=UPI003F8383F2
MNLNKKLSEILDPKKIEVVKNPIEKAHGLPNECYLNDDYLEFEKEKVFKNNWTMVGVASSVPNPGDAKPFNLLDIPILIVRNKDNEIKVFHNVCSHRGFKLVDQECKLKNVIRCPYHSWSYDFNGKLTVTPHIGGLGKHDVEGFDKNNSNLKEIRSKVWMDLIFININFNAKPFEEFIKPLEDRWSKFISKKDQQLIRHASDNGYFNMTVNSNWKFAIENYCESYHLPWIHPELNRVSNIADHYHIEDENFNFSGQGSGKYSQQFDGNIKFKCFPNWPSEVSEKSEYVSLYPNVMLGIHIDHFYAFWLEPISNNQTKEHFELYYIGDESASSDEFKRIREKNFAFWQEVMNEDVTAIEGMQKGRSSPAYNGGNFSPVMDTPTLMFHKWVATNLTK